MKIKALMPAFLDEMEKISIAMPNVAQAGAWAGKHVGALGAGLKAAPGAVVRGIKAAPGAIGRGIVNAPKNFATGSENVGRAITAFGTPIQSLKKGWHETWTPGGKPLHPGFKALMAYGALQGAHDTAKKEDPTGMGRSRVHRGLQFAGGQLGGVIAAPFGLAGGIAGSMIGDKAGDITGRFIDRFRGHRTPISLPPSPQGLQR